MSSKTGLAMALANQKSSFPNYKVRKNQSTIALGNADLLPMKLMTK